jgi:hypothetical protein
MKDRRIGWIAGAVVVLVLIYAWIDGGERALHPIVQPVPVPASAR